VRKQVTLEMAESDNDNNGQFCHWYSLQMMPYSAERHV